MTNGFIVYGMLKLFFVDSQIEVCYQKAMAVSCCLPDVVGNNLIIGKGLEFSMKTDGGTGMC